jgi:MFS transporter, OFA family, oxalate/formate antiporter
VFGSMLAGTIVDSTGTYTLAYTAAAILCLAAAALTLVTKPPAPRAIIEQVRQEHAA